MVARGKGIINDVHTQIDLHLSGPVDAVWPKSFWRFEAHYSFGKRSFLTSHARETFAQWICVAPDDDRNPPRTEFFFFCTQLHKLIERFVNLNVTIYYTPAKPVPKY